MNDSAITSPLCVFVSIDFFGYKTAQMKSHRVEYKHKLTLPQVKREASIALWGKMKDTIGMKGWIMMSGQKQNNIELQVIARIHTDFPSKFGIPRQSGLVESLEGKIIFEPEFQNEASVKGIENYTYLWLIWQFSETADKSWSPTVRPPRLGGNTRIGVFASRSPFRPNHLGLSSVRLTKVEMDEKLGPILYVSGVDLMDNTPIFDIKPYVPYADSHPEASTGIFEGVVKKPLTVDIPLELVDKIPAKYRETLKDVLAQDPRPSYQNDEKRIYGIAFAGLNVRFRVDEDVLRVVQVDYL